MRRPDGELRLFNTANGLPDDFVAQLWTDRAGNIWARCSTGTAVYQHGAWRYPEFDAGQPYYSKLLANGDLWIATPTKLVRDPSIVWFDEPGPLREMAKLKKAVASSYPRVQENWCTALDGQQRVYLGFLGNLWRFDGRRWTDLTEKINHPDSVSFVKADSQGRIWIGTSAKGLYRFTGDRLDGFFTEGHRPTTVIYSMAEAGTGTVYIGAQFGFYAFKGNQPRTISTHYQVHDLLADGLGRVWACDINSGLLLYDGKTLHELSAEEPQLSGWQIQSLSLAAPDTVRADAVAFGPTGTRRAAFECNGQTVKAVNEK